MKQTDKKPPENKYGLKILERKKKIIKESQWKSAG